MFKTHIPFKFATLGLMALCALPSMVQAHYIWIERGAKDEFEGKSFEAIRHRATLTVVQPRGNRL